MNNVEMVTVFCPRGCNVTEVTADDPWDECGACGQRMTPQYEEDFHSVHERDLDKIEFEGEVAIVLRKINKKAKNHGCHSEIWFDLFLQAAKEILKDESKELIEEVIKQSGFEKSDFIGDHQKQLLGSRCETCNTELTVQQVSHSITQFGDMYCPSCIERNYS